MLLSMLSALLLTFTGWQTRVGRHFDIHYQAPDRYTIEEVEDRLEEAYDELSGIFDARIREKVDVYIHPDQHSMVTVTRVENASRWLVGLAVNGREIHVVSPLNPPEQHSAQSVYEGLVHELVHICVHQMIPRRLPLWLNEGLAVYFARQHQFAREVPGILRSRPGLPLLDDLSDPLTFEKNRGYALSYTLIEFLVRQHGLFALKQFLTTYPDYAPLGWLSEMQLEVEWQQYLAGQYLNPPLLQRYLDHSDNVFEAFLNPNPVSGKATLEFVTTGDQIFSLRLLDPWGEPMQLIFQRPLRSGFHGFQIDATRFPPGVYYLELTSGQTVQLIRFVKR